jgi:hypothetical protein
LSLHRISKAEVLRTSSYRDMSRPSIRLHTVDTVERILHPAVRPLIVTPYPPRRYSARSVDAYMILQPLYTAKDSPKQPFLTCAYVRRWRQTATEHEVFRELKTDDCMTHFASF